MRHDRWFTTFPATEGAPAHIQGSSPDPKLASGPTSLSFLFAPSLRASFALRHGSQPCAPACACSLRRSDFGKPRRLHTSTAAAADERRTEDAAQEIVEKGEACFTCRRCPAALQRRAAAPAQRCPHACTPRPQSAAYSLLRLPNGRASPAACAWRNMTRAGRLQPVPAAVCAAGVCSLRTCLRGDVWAHLLPPFSSEGCGQPGRPRHPPSPRPWPPTR